ncbi:LacI family DNA-binding transcriptional regulator [Paenibacillus endoradicis]|uniref:LacI family DNA-binding transcriptional regulator n=1 Tax=Paenibacillus endoradicis TaxID=2972487 RepID=UPI0021597868|nr:LacI family DNA-binding transcriptional regulator [Paenibacillus endoradicis]MCR8659791.1 LacI family transcriptional regulator [Paenibacillus endoradicis]
MASIKDIAKQAGVSISTVSYALNGSEKVTKETAARILAIAKELNYVPHAAARLLKTKKSNLIGIFLTDFSGNFYGDLLQGVKDYLHLRGYDLLVCSGSQSRRLIAERMIDGAIILDETFSTEELLQYTNNGHKAVVLDRELNHSHINQVLLDNKAGATLAMEYLIEQGHDKIYTVTGPEGSYDANQRLRAVHQVIARIPQVEFHEISGDFSKAAGEAAAKRIANEYTRPVAVFCLNDEMAIGLYRYIRIHSDLIIGEHIHLIGFDNIELAQFIQPRLATINYSMHKWGALASEQLLKMLSGESVEPERIYVSLIKGETIKALN